MKGSNMAKKPEPKKGTAVATTKGSAVSTNVKAPMGLGFEEADADSFAIPFLSILQKLSPQCDKDDPKYIKGAEPGMFINTVTNELFEEVEIIPCSYQRRFNRWAPRDGGGGFKGMYLPSAIAGLEGAGTIAASEEGRWFFTMPDGGINEKKSDQLTDTRLHFCLMVTDEGLMPVLITLSRTQLKKSKNWMSLMKNRGGNMFSTVYSGKTVDEENDKGKWKGWAIDVERVATDPEQAEGMELFKSIGAGKVQAKFDQATDGAEA